MMGCKRTLHSILRSQRTQTSQPTNHKVREQLVPGLTSAPVLLETRYRGSILLVVLAAGEGRGEDGLRGRGIGSGPSLLLDGRGGLTDDWRGATHQGGRGFVGERHGCGLDVLGGGEMGGVK